MLQHTQKGPIENQAKKENQVMNNQQVGRVVNINQSDFDIYIGRANTRRRLKGSKWANPFRIGPDGSRDEVIAKYRAWITQKPELLEALGELQGKRLGCWCKPDACHGDVLVELLTTKAG